MAGLTQQQIDRLRTLGELRQAGTVDDHEFASLKAKLLAAVEAGAAEPADPSGPAPTAAAAPAVSRQLPQYQLMTPRAPLAPGAGVRIYPVVMGEFDEPDGPGRWATDPTGRHELRWWSGTRWTDHVADAGDTATDPLDS